MIGIRGPKVINETTAKPDFSQNLQFSPERNLRKTPIFALFAVGSLIVTKDDQRNDQHTCHNKADAQSNVDSHQIIQLSMPHTDGCPSMSRRRRIIGSSSIIKEAKTTQQICSYGNSL